MASSPSCLFCRIGSPNTPEGRIARLAASHGVIFQFIVTKGEVVLDSHKVSYSAGSELCNVFGDVFPSLTRFVVSGGVKWYDGLTATIKETSEEKWRGVPALERTLVEYSGEGESWRWDTSASVIRMKEFLSKNTCLVIQFITFSVKVLTKYWVAYTYNRV